MIQKTFQASEVQIVIWQQPTEETHPHIHIVDNTAPINTAFTVLNHISGINRLLLPIQCAVPTIRNNYGAPDLHHIVNPRHLVTIVLADDVIMSNSNVLVSFYATNERNNYDLWRGKHFFCCNIDFQGVSSRTDSLLNGMRHSVLCHSNGLVIRIKNVYIFWI